MSVHAVTVEARNVLVTELNGRVRRHGFYQTLWLEAESGAAAAARALQTVRSDLLAAPGFVKNPETVTLTVDQVKLAEDIDKCDGERSGRVYYPAARWWPF